MQEELEQNQNKETSSEKKSGYYINQPNFGDQGPSKLRQQLNRGMTAFVVIILCMLCFFVLLRMDDISKVLKLIFNILRPIIYGLAIAYLLNPIVKTVERYLKPWVEKRFPNFKKTQKLCRGIGIVAALVVMLAVISALFNMLIPELYRSIRNLALTLPGQINEALRNLTVLMSQDTTLGKFFTTFLTEATTFFQNWMRTDLLSQVNDFMSHLTEGVFNVVNEVMNAVIGIIVSVYVLYSKEKFSMQSKKIIYALFKPSHANMILHLSIKSNTIFGGFIIGKIIDSAIIGVLCFIGLSILDMPYTVLVSVIVGVTNVIPFFGPYIGAIPSAILLLLTDPIKGLYFLVFIIFLQQLDGNIIGPKILGDSTGLSAFWVVFSILLGGGLFGFAGMIMGVPTFAVIYYLFQMFINQNLEKKHLPTDSAVYDDTSYVDAESGEFIHGNNDEQNIGEAQVRGKEDCEKEEEK